MTPDNRIRNLIGRVVELFGERALRKSALSIRGGGGAFEVFLGDGKFKTALEIGTYKGVSAAALAQFCNKVHTIDLADGKLEGQSTQWDRHAFWQALGVADKIELHLVRDNDEKKRLIRQLQFDVAFVDGDHGPGVRLDFELVKHCGAVLFHDYDRRGIPDLDHVYDFVNSLPKTQVRTQDIFAFWERPWTA